MLLSKTMPHKATRFLESRLFGCLGGVVQMYFLSSLRAQTAKTLICTKSGVFADSRKSAKKCGNKKSTFCVKNAQKGGFFPHFFGTLSRIGENPTFCAD